METYSEFYQAFCGNGRRVPEWCVASAGDSDRVCENDDHGSTRVVPTTPDNVALQAAAPSMLCCLLSVFEIIEATYDHDENGQRTNGASQQSAADIVDWLVEQGQQIAGAMRAAMPR